MVRAASDNFKGGIKAIEHIHDCGKVCGKHEQ